MPALDGRHRRTRPSSGLLSRQHLLNAGDGICGVFVFPDSDNGPSGRSKRAFIRDVSLPVGVEFAGPPFDVGLRERGVFGASVPEAAIDEHDHARDREDDVCLAPKAGDRPLVLEKAEAGAVQRRP
jgi:hypothetical protein